MRPAQGFRRVSHIMISVNEQMKEDEQAVKKEKIENPIQFLQNVKNKLLPLKRGGKFC